VKFERQSLVRTVKVSVIVSLLLMSFLAGYIFASPSFTAPDIYLDSLPSTASYVIDTDGTYIWAIRYDGKIAYNGTDASTVIQAAIDASPAMGTVMLKGELGITNTLTINAQTHYQLNLIFNQLNILTDVDGIIIDRGGGNGLWHGRLIGNFIRFPPNYSKKVITLKNIIYGTIDVNFIYPQTGTGLASSIGVHLLGDGAGCYFNSVRVTGIGALGEGIRLESTVGGFSNANTIYNTAIVSVQEYGVRMIKNGTNVSGNTFISVSVNSIQTGKYGFYNADGDNVFVGCRVIDSVSGAIDWFTVDLTGNKRPRLYGCQKGGGSIVGSFIHYGTNNFVTESSGTATIANNEYISHGLAGTPTIVTITPRATVYDGVTFIVGCIARNSTHFQVGATWTNGTAITADAINIDWYSEYNP